MRVLGCLALGLTTLAAVPRALIAGEAGVTPFEPGASHVVVAVRLNGQGPFRLLLDTGSTHTAVSTKTAESIGAPVVAKAPMGSAAGSRMTLVVRIDALAIGPVVVHDLLASVVEVEEMPDGEGIDGVIGQDALGSLRYTIDFRERRVVWGANAGAGGRGTSLDLQPSSGRFLLTLPQRQSLLRLVPDSGAASLLLFAPPDALPVTRLPGLATLTTTSGKTGVRPATVRELHIGTLMLRDVPAVVADRNPSEPDEVDGLLPLHLFDRVTVDGPGKRLILEKSQQNGV